MVATGIERAECRTDGAMAMLRLILLPLTISACAVSVFALAVEGAEKYRPTPIGPTAADRLSDRVSAARKVQGNFTVGDRYTVNVKRGGFVQSYEGKVLKVSEQWIVLRDYSTTMSTPVATRFAKIPVIGSWVRRTSEKPCEVDRWIPREAVTVASHSKAANPVTIREPLGNEPPLNAGGKVEVARDGKVARPSGHLAAINGNNVTLNADDASGSQRELFARRDLFCVAYSGPCSDPDEAK